MVLIYSRPLTHACSLLNHNLKEYPSNGEELLSLCVASLLTWWSCLLTGFGRVIWRAHHRAVQSFLVEAARSFSAMTNNRVSMKQKQVRTGSTWERGTYAYHCNISYLCPLWNELSAAGAWKCWQSPPCVSPGWCKWPYDACWVPCGCWGGRGCCADTPFYPEGFPPATHRHNQPWYSPLSPRNRFLTVILRTLLQQNSCNVYFVEYLCFINVCALFLLKAHLMFQNKGDIP